MKRQHQLLLIAASVLFSWLAMQAVHELGHVAAAAASGGRIGEVILYPTTISYTRLTENPHPLFVAWMGPIVGVVLPCIAMVIARLLRWRGWYLFQFFAGFCLITNGAYLAFGSLNVVGDAGDILRHATPPWLLWLFGAITIPIGLWSWNGLGRHFGLGSNAEQVDRTVTYFISACVLILVTLELVFSSPAARP